MNIPLTWFRRRRDSFALPGNCSGLSCELLEQRFMLSTFEVIAAGTTNQEDIELQIDGQTVQTWTDLGGDAYANQFVTLHHSTANTVSPDQVRIEFTNDFYDPDNGVDRNVRIDAVIIDGNRYEAESADVYSTGTWLPTDGIQPGFRQSEFLHADGYLQFGGGASDTTEITINARGEEGSESFSLQIDGVTVQTWNDIGTTDTAFDYTASGVVSADQVRLVFLNDQYDPDNNIDRNLTVDYLSVGGTLYQTEAPTVYSTGTWLPADGIQPGFRQHETLHTNGYFQFDAPSPGQSGSLSLSLSSLTIDEDVRDLTIVVFRTGGSDGTVTVDYSTVFGTSDINDLVPITGTLTFADGVTDGFLSVTVNDDNQVEDSETFSLLISNPAGGATMGAITEQQITISDNDEITPGILFDDSFENSFSWTANPSNTDSATTGQWEIGAPQQTTSGSTTLQLDSGSTGARALITGLTAGASAGANDVDSGVTSVLSPEIVLPDTTGIELRFDYYLAHLDNATSDDYFSASILVDGNATVVYTDAGQNTDQAAAWTDVSVNLSAFSGQTIQVLFEAADSAGGSLVEAGVDDVVVEVLSILPGTISVETPTVNVDESVGNAVITVVRNNGRTGVVSIDYAAVAGTADNDDFTAVTGTLVFADGQSAATISVPVADDTEQEPLQNFSVILSNPTGGAISGSVDTATITIVDNDNTVGDYLPDFVPVASALTEQLHVDTSEIPGRTLLRFSSEVANAGNGPLEIWGGDSSGSTQDVFQRIYQEDGGSRDRLAGEFVFHSNHGHIHFEGFANYNLLQFDGSDSIVASGGKTSFCLINIRQPFPDVTASADRVHGRGGDSCGQIQGLSVGYSDVYSSSLDGQWIDITDVADGTYWLEVIADPDNRIQETDESNNATRVQITISNGEVSF